MLRPVALPPWTLAGLGLLSLVGCGSQPKPRLDAPDQATVKKLAAAERAYRADAPEYAALRDELMRDPVSAGWLTRMFVRDLFTVREGRALGTDEDLLRAAAKIEDPKEQRAIQEIVVLGPAAVPVLIGDLLLYDQAQPRELGIELLTYVGAPSVAAVLEVVRSSNPRHRRAGARVLGRLAESPEAIPTLRELAKDSDYTVRADAARGLRHGGALAGDLLRTMVARDADPFVRRVAATALLGHPGRTTAEVLVDYLQRCQTELETRGYEVAQECLQKLASARGPRTPDAWRNWIHTLPADAAAGR